MPSILVAGPDFGTGSSREHAVWALQDYGFRVVLSPRFGDIFRGNSLKAGLLTVARCPRTSSSSCGSATEQDPAAEVTVDLERREVRYGGTTVGFELDDFTRWRLLNGLDDIGLTLHPHRRGRRVRGAPAGVPAHHPAGPLSIGDRLLGRRAVRGEHRPPPSARRRLPRRADAARRGAGARRRLRCRRFHRPAGDARRRRRGARGGRRSRAWSRRRAGHASPSVRFAVCRAQELDRVVPADSTDAVFSVAALHWVPDGRPSRDARAGAPGAARGRVVPGPVRRAAGRSRR